MLNKFLFGNLVVYEMWKNIVKPQRAQMTIKYGARALYVG